VDITLEVIVPVVAAFPAAVPPLSTQRDPLQPATTRSGRI